MPVIKLSSPATREFWEIPVLFEDDHLLALDKPAFLLTSPDRLDPQKPSLMGLLHAGIASGKPWAKERGLTYLMNVHRLDFEVPGVLLLAKSKPVFVTVANLFSSDRLERVYAALVQGCPMDDHFEVDAGISMHPTSPDRMRINTRTGKKARTRFEVAERFSGYALLKCRLGIERTHQVRIHLLHVRYPILGDTLYRGGRLWLSELKRDFHLKPGAEERPLISSVALHASSLAFAHPVTGDRLVITSPEPKDFKVALKYLRRHAPTWNRRMDPA